MWGKFMRALDNIAPLVTFGFHLGNKRGSDWSIFCFSKDSLTPKGLADLKVYLANEFVVKAPNGWYVFTKKAMSR
jgi:hypothetical protein